MPKRLRLYSAENVPSYRTALTIVPNSLSVATHSFIKSLLWRILHFVCIWIFICNANAATRLHIQFHMCQSTKQTTTNSGSLDADFSGPGLIQTEATENMVTTTAADDDADNEQTGSVVAHEKMTTTPSTGDHIEVLWPLDNTYYPATFTCHNSRPILHSRSSPVTRWDIEVSRIRRLLRILQNPDTTLNVYEVQLSPAMELETVEKDTMGTYHKAFGTS